MVEVTQADIECENNVEWALHKERVGGLPVGEGVKLARCHIAQHRTEALTTAQAEIEALRAKVAELEGENQKLKGLNRTHIKSAFFAGFDAARQPNRSDAWEESETRKRIDYPRATLGKQP